MSDDQDQLEFAADDARHAASTPRTLKCHEAMDSIEELKEFIKRQEREIAALKMNADKKPRGYDWGYVATQYLHEITGLRKSLADTTQERDNWRAAAESHKKHMDVSNSTNARLMADLRDLRSNFDEAVKDRDGQKLAVATLQSNLEIAEKANTSLAADVKALADVNGRLNLSVPQLHNSLKATTESRDEWRSKAGELSRSVTTITGDRDWWKDVAAERKQSLNEQSAKITDLERTLESTKSASEYLKRDLEEANAENAEYLKKISSQSEKIVKLEAQLISLGATADDLEEQVKRLTDEKRNKINNGSYEDGAQSRQWIIDEKSKIIMEQSRLLSSHRLEIDEQAKTIKTLQDELDDIRESYAASQKARVDMAQIRHGLGMDSVVIPKDELRERLRLLRLADPDEAGWNTLAKTVRSATEYLEKKLAQK